MSEKPVVNTQECDPSTLGLARKPRPAMKRKPQTEVVVQLGPFTDGQITAPEMVRPLEGPTEWLIKPKTGEIVPFDAGTPPEKDVIRKYITVGAQDNDVPEDLPKLSEGYVVERVNQDPLPSMDGKVGENGTDTVRVVEKEGPASVECKDPPQNPPVTDSEEPPPVEPPPVEPPPVEPPPVEPPPVEPPPVEPPPVEPPPVEPPPVEPPPVEPPPVDEEEECKTPIDAVNDCASTQKDCPVVIDVIENDIGCGDMKIIEACAENGSVDIKDGKLHYTPNEGFCGEDVITYTIGDENSMTDTAHVYMNVESGYNTAPDSDCPTDYSSEYSSGDDKIKMNDYEYSSEAYDKASSIFDETNSQLQGILDKANSAIESKAGWSTSFGSNSIDASACAPVEEPVAVC